MISPSRVLGQSAKFAVAIAQIVLHTVRCCAVLCKLHVYKRPTRSLPSTRVCTYAKTGTHPSKYAIFCISKIPWWKLSPHVLGYTNILDVHRGLGQRANMRVPCGHHVGANERVCVHTSCGDELRSGTPTGHLFETGAEQPPR